MQSGSLLYCKALAGRLVVCASAIATVIFLCHRVAPVNATTVALLLLLVVLGVAARWGLAEAIFSSVLSMLGFNFYFLPPIGTLTISDPENWVALFAFLVTAVLASHLSAQAKTRTLEAEKGRNEIGRLYEISRAMLMDEARDAMRLSVARAGQILGLSGIAFFDLASGQIYGALENGIARDDLNTVAATGVPMEEIACSVIPVRLGTRVVGSLALQGGTLSPTVRDSVASLLAINYERVRALHLAAAAEVARRNEEFKSSLLDGLAHDLKTPLTAIRTCVTSLITIPPRTEASRLEMLTIIEQESRRLQQSITEAIELARIESQELHLNRAPVLAAELLEMALAETREENWERYSIDVPRGLEIDADGELIRRALTQILENARKYAPPDSPIQLTVENRHGEAVISISDRGPGIQPDELEKVFEKFYRGRRGRNIVEGTGMGLAIARGIIEAHGGRIRAENRPGGGATISFSLPLSSTGSHE